MSAKPLSNSEFDQIHRTFLESGILLFRDQKITREQHIAFSRRFGELDNHDSLPRDRHPDYPELLLVTNIPKENGKPSDSQVHRPAMALRHVVHAGAVARLAAARHHHPAGRRRHDVHQHVPGLRRAVGRHEEDDRAAARHPYRLAQGRRSELGSREGAEEDQSADRPAGGARPSRDRQEGALYRREGVVLRRHDGRGEQAADRLPGEARDAAAVRLSPSMEAGRHHPVGQSLHHAHRARRLCRKARPAISSAPP